MADEMNTELSSAPVDCDEAVRQLFVYLDGELTDAKRRAITAHLDECVHCADSLQFEAELRAIVASRVQERVPETLIERVKAALQAEGDGADSVNA